MAEQFEFNSKDFELLVMNGEQGIEQSSTQQISSEKSNSDGLNLLNLHKEKHLRPFEPSQNLNQSILTEETILDQLHHANDIVHILSFLKIIAKIGTSASYSPVLKVIEVYPQIEAVCEQGLQSIFSLVKRYSDRDIDHIDPLSLRFIATLIHHQSANVRVLSYSILSFVEKDRTLATLIKGLDDDSENVRITVIHELHSIIKPSDIDYIEAISNTLNDKNIEIQRYALSILNRMIISNTIHERKALRHLSKWLKLYRASVEEELLYQTLTILNRLVNPSDSEIVEYFHYLFMLNLDKQAINLLITLLEKVDIKNEDSLIPHLEKLIYHSNKADTKRIIKVLEAIHTPLALKALIQFLKSAKEKELIEFGGRNVVQFINPESIALILTVIPVEMMTKPKQITLENVILSEIRQQLALESKAMLHALKMIIQKGDPVLRYRAMLILLDTPKYLDENDLIQLAADPEHVIKLKATKALGKTGGVKVIEFLHSQLEMNQNDPQMTSALILSLGECGFIMDIPYLEPYLKSAQAEIIKDTVIALSLLGSRDYRHELNAYLERESNNEKAKLLVKAIMSFPDWEESKVISALLRDPMEDLRDTIHEFAKNRAMTPTLSHKIVNHKDCFINRWSKVLFYFHNHSDVAIHSIGLQIDYPFLEIKNNYQYKLLEGHRSLSFPLEVFYPERARLKVPVTIYFKDSNGNLYEKDIIMLLKFKRRLKIT